MQVCTEMMPISCSKGKKWWVSSAVLITQRFILKKSKLEDQEIGHNHGSYV